MEIFSCWSQWRNAELGEVLEEIGKFVFYFVISLQGIVIPPLAGWLIRGVIPILLDSWQMWSIARGFWRRLGGRYFVNAHRYRGYCDPLHSPSDWFRHLVAAHCWHLWSFVSWKLCICRVDAFMKSLYVYCFFCLMQFSKLLGHVQRKGISIRMAFEITFLLSALPYPYEFRCLVFLFLFISIDSKPVDCSIWKCEGPHTHYWS